MAKVEVTGTVARVFASKGFSLRETFTLRDNRIVTRYWSVFVPDGQPVQVAGGDTVKASGLLGAEVSSRDARYVDYKISNAAVEHVGTPPERSWGPPEPPADDYPPNDSWPTAAPAGEGTPY